MDVGLRELKAKLSSYVKRASAGETITVTDHGRPVAVLAPAMGRADLEVAAAQGWVRLPASRGLPPVRRHPGSRRISEVLDEDRAG